MLDVMSHGTTAREEPWRVDVGTWDCGGSPSRVMLTILRGRLCPAPILISSGMLEMDDGMEGVMDAFYT